VGVAAALLFTRAFSFKTKEVVIPVTKEERKPRAFEPHEFVRNVMGSWFFGKPNHFLKKFQLNGLKARRLVLDLANSIFTEVADDVKCSAKNSPINNMKRCLALFYSLFSPACERAFSKLDFKEKGGRRI
jgi:hypothetical protein